MGQGTQCMQAWACRGRDRVDNIRDPALIELFKPYWLSAEDGGQCAVVLGLEVHWLWLTKPGSGWAGGVVEGEFWGCNLSPA